MSAVWANIVVIVITTRAIDGAPTFRAIEIVKTVSTTDCFQLFIIELNAFFFSEF